MAGLSYFYGCIAFHCIYHPKFMCSSIKVNLGYFHFFIIVNNAAINMGIQMFLCGADHFLWVYTQKRVYFYILSLNFLRNPESTFCKGCTHSHFYQQYSDILFSFISPRVVASWLFDNSHPLNCVLVFHYGFYLHF